MHDFYLPKVANRYTVAFYIILKLTVEKHQYLWIFTRQPEIGV